MDTVSIIILNWNGKRFLSRCLPSLLKITYAPVEIIVVDNNSTDGSVEYAKKNFPTIRIVQNKKNEGFARGNNIGFGIATGKYILFLNNDTVVTPTFLSPLMQAITSDPSIGCIQPQIRTLQQKNVLDEVGSFLTFTGFLYHYGYLKDSRKKQYRLRKEIFSAKGACILVPRHVLEKLGCFDEDFFIFFEETDLCFRMWLSGFRVVYEPTSVIYHLVAGDTSREFTDEKRMYLITKNMLCSYIKNFGTYELVRIFPVFIFLHACLLVYYMVTMRPRLIKSIGRAYYWNLIHLGDTLKKRAFVQGRLRKIVDGSLASRIMRNPPLAYYYYLFTDRLQRYED